jgi:acetyl esterase/lipase
MATLCMDYPPQRAPNYGRRTLVRRLHLTLLAVSLLFLFAGCSSAQRNVAAYLLADATGALQPADPSSTGIISGTVRGADGPLAGATLVVADRIGTPYSGRSDADGRFQLEAPVGSYAISGVAPGYAEGQTHDDAGTTEVVAVEAGALVDAPQLVLTPLANGTPPIGLAAQVQLTQTNAYTTTSAFPPGSAAQVTAFSFTRDGVVNDTLRLYMPLGTDEDTDDAAQLPLLLAVYPGTVDGWEPVSTSLAAQGYALVAVSPVGAWELNVDQHAADARTALALAEQGALGTGIDASQPVALGGSFSSAILYRLLRQTPDIFGGWVTVGGIADAFSGAAAFYSDAITIPDAYRFAIPAMGNPSRNPVALLEFSPLYDAGSLPPTLIIHTAADEIIPIEQAYAFEAALREAGVPVETFYYEDVSHYLQIEEEMTDAGREMFYRVVEFIDRY